MSSQTREIIDLHHAPHAEVELPIDETVIRVLAQNFFEKCLPATDRAGAVHEYGTGRFEISEQLEADLARVVGQAEAWHNERRITPEMRQAVAVFLQEMVAFIVRLKKDCSSADVQNFIDELHDRLFAVSPSIINLLDLPGQIKFAARTTRVPEAQAMVGAGMMGELAYELAYAAPEISERLYADIVSRPVAEQLDYINVYETVGVTAAANGEWADPALEHIGALAERLAVDSPFPLVRYSAESLHAALAKEWQEPSHGVVQFSGGREYGRVAHFSAQMQRDHQELSRAVLLDRSLRRDEHLTRVAADAIGVCDQSGLLHSLATHVETAALRPLVGEDFNGLQKIMVRLEQRQPLDAREISQIMAILSDKAPDWWAEVGIYSPAEWTRFLELENNLTDLQQQFRAQEAELMHAAETKNLEASHQFVGQVLALLKTAPNMHTVAQEIVDYRTAGDDERAFTAAERAAVQVSYADSGQAGRAAARATTLLDTIRRAHASSWYTYEQERTALRDSLETAAWLDEYAELKDKIMTGEQFKDGLAKKLTSELHAHTEKLPHAALQAGEAVFADPVILPYGAEQSEYPTDSAQPPAENDWLLFQQLHQPRLREYVEQFFNLSLAEIPLRDQVHLLRFLAEKDQGTMDRLAAALNRPDLNRAALIKSFFACAADIHIGDELLNFVEATPAENTNRIFAHYAEMVDEMTAVEQQIGSFFTTEVATGGVTGGAQIDTRHVVQEMLARANKILLGNITAHAELDPAALETQLATIEKDMALFASLFKTVFKSAREHGQEIAVADIAGLSLETQLAGALSELDKAYMRDLAVKNNLVKGQLRPFAERVVLPGLEKALTTPHNRFVILKKGQKIITFLRFEDTAEGVYFGSFNVAPSAQGAGIGELMMRQSLATEAATHPIAANVEVDNPIAAKYINEYNFVATKILRDVAGTGVTGFDIVRDDRVVAYERATPYVVSDQCSVSSLASKAWEKSRLVITFAAAEMEQLLAAIEAPLATGTHVLSYFSPRQGLAIIEHRRPYEREAAISQLPTATTARKAG